MKINSIVLYNFGSYEGEAIFDTASSQDRNIVLIGGKNGAGKTTLFTAMRVCLYGYMSMGYKNANSHYTRAITKLINNSAKMVKPANAAVKMHLGISNGRAIDEYVLSRSWVLDETFTENFSVVKNGETLSSEEVADFEKYLLSLLPPELFNLYFFDGEKIADFFLEEGSNARIKNAFLTLCGYDTFDIMRKNFKRTSANAGNSGGLDEYLAAQEKVQSAMKECQELSRRIFECKDAIAACEADIVAAEKEYTQKGGISQEEWNQKLITIREEEKKRESWNALLKKWANDVVPFLMVREQIKSVRSQIEDENDSLKYRNFCEMLDEPAIRVLLERKLAEIQMTAFQLFGSEVETILDLSFEQSSTVMSQINTILSFDAEKIEKCKRAIRRSLALSAKTRQELENSSVSFLQEYMKHRAELFETKSELLTEQFELEQQLASRREELSALEAEFTRIHQRLEEELKQASIADISTKAIIMLDKLQKVLYGNQIEKVEAFFREEINTLMRKSQFIDDIEIDNDFNVHIYRNEKIKAGKMITALKTNDEGQLTAMFGRAALIKLKEEAQAETVLDMIAYCKASGDDMISLPIEIDKTSLSNGEKQIFIMALYHSLVRLCKHEVPFIIDTPFARIDTEHRRNISEHFFSKLNGQVFILSTNEEIDSEHVKILRDKIAATYMLENTDNKRTVIVKNTYFEV